MNRLENYLTSNAGMRLTKSFNISIKVLCSEHLEELKKKVGTANLIPFDYKWSWMFFSPCGSAKKPEMFEGQCAIISTYLAHCYNLQNSGIEVDGYNQKALQTQIGRTRQLKAEKTAEFVELGIIQTLASIQEDYNRTGYVTQKIMPKLSEELKAQIHIFSSTNPAFKVESYPECFDPTMEQIYLYETEGPDNTDHLDAILDLKKFFSNQKQEFCFFCEKIKSFVYNVRHSCLSKKQKGCRSCRRMIFNENYWSLPQNKNQFCDQRLNEIFGTCPKCNVTFKSVDCESMHKHPQCSVGYVCSKGCGQYIPVYNNRTERKQSHFCGEKRCGMCHKIHLDLQHVCKIKRQEPQAQWNKMCFLTISYLTKFLEETGEETQIPIQACLMHETEKPGHFETKLFHKEEEPISSCDMEINYCPENIDFQLDNKGRPGAFGHPTKEKGKKSKRIRCKNVLGNLLSLIRLADNFNNITVVVQSPDDLFEINCAMVKEKLYPEVIRKEGKVMQVKMKDRNVRFISITSYQPGYTQQEMCSLMNVEMCDPYFPTGLSFSIPDNTPVCQADFLDFDDNDNERSKKGIYASSLNAYDLRRNGLNHVREMTEGFAKFSLDYVKQSFEFQQQIITDLKCNFKKKGKHMPLLHPLSSPFVSGNSFIYGVWKLFELNDQDLDCIPSEHTGLSEDKVSQAESQWVYYLNIVHYDNKLRAYYNDRKGQDKSFRFLTPDAVDYESKTTFFYSGCFHHLHSPLVCPRNKSKKLDDLWGKTGKTVKEVMQQNDLKMSKFKALYPDWTVIIKWDCQWAREKEENEEVKRFFEENPWALKAPVNRLVPRDSVRGGMSETYNFHWKKEENLGEHFFIADLTSQYPSLALSKTFPLGSFDVLVGRDLDDVSFENNVMKHKGEDINGLVMVTIDPPQGLFYPFLLYRVEKERSVATLCTTCCTKKLNVCTHKGMERYITGTYTVPEINYALSLGYRVVRLYEIWMYRRMGNIFGNVYKLLLRNKIKFSGLPVTALDEFEEYAFCQAINSQLDLPSNLTLLPEDVVRDNKLRQFYKLLANAIIGKLGQNNEYPKDVFVHTASQILKHTKDSNSVIEDIALVNEDTMYLRVSKKKKSNQNNRTGNCLIYAYLTAYARIGMHKSVCELSSNGSKVFALEADAIAFSTPSDVQPMEFGETIGAFKSEFQNIEAYSTLGPKTSAIQYRIGDNLHSLVKVKGLNLSGDQASSTVSNDLYEDFVQNLLLGIEQKIGGNCFLFK